MDRWLFGYGSLLWRPDFEHEEWRAARIDGWVRRFWQGSVDHRGVPGRPGRVVTLLPQRGGHCMGAVFRVRAERWDAVLERLDMREVGGYDRVELRAKLQDDTVPALAYVATERNRNYLGDAPLREIARQVLDAEGPSGHNVDYVLRLAEWLRERGAHDAHALELEAEVRRLLG